MGKEQIAPSAGQTGRNGDRKRSQILGDAWDRLSCDEIDFIDYLEIVRPYTIGHDLAPDWDSLIKTHQSTSKLSVQVR